MAFNPSQANNEAGIDTIVSNSRVRALTGPVTFTDSSGAVTLSSIPLGVNYIDGAGAPFSTSFGGSSAVTLAANSFLTGVIVMTNTSGTTVTTDTAAHFFAACSAISPSGVQAGDYISCLLMNDSTSSVIITGGTGVTSVNASTSSLAANTSRYCLFRFNNATSLNLYY